MDPEIEESVGSAEAGCTYTFDTPLVADDFAFHVFGGLVFPSPLVDLLRVEIRDPDGNLIIEPVN